MKGGPWVPDPRATATAVRKAGGILPGAMVRRAIAENA